MHDFRAKMKKMNFWTLPENKCKIQNLGTNACIGSYADSKKKTELSSFKALGGDRFVIFLFFLIRFFFVSKSILKEFAGAKNLWNCILYQHIEFQNTGTNSKEFQNFKT